MFKLACRVIQTCKRFISSESIQYDFKKKIDSTHESRLKRFWVNDSIQFIIQVAFE